MSFPRILIAVDNGPIAAHAAEVGAELAVSLKSDVALIHVIDPSAVVAPEGGVPAVDMTALATEEGKRLLVSFRQRMPPQLYPLEFLQVGKPASEIVKVAKEWPADLIVIGSHGRGGISRVLLGSVAEGVMRHATCPILVIRAGG